MPPTKLKNSVKTVDRQTGKVTVTHFYIKNATDIELLDIVENSNTKPKLKQKCLNELVRRRTDRWEKK